MHRNENEMQVQAGGLTRRTMLSGTLATMVGGSAFLAACSSAGGTTSTGGARPKATIINTSGTPSIVLGRLINELGYFKQFGVDAKITYVVSGNEAIAALTSGSADISTISGLISVFPAIEKGLPLKVIAGTGVVSTDAIFAADPAVRSIRDLPGKTVATGPVGNIINDVFLALMKKYGVSSKDVTFVDVGSSADAFKAVLAKRVDVGYGQVANQAEADPKGVRMITTVDGQFPLWINQGAITSTNTIKSNREGLVRVLAAYAKLFQWLTTSGSRSKYIDAYIASGGIKAEGEIEWQFVNQHTVFSPTLTLPVDKVNFVQQQNVINGQQKKILPFASYTDLSLATDAVKLAKT